MAFPDFQRPPTCGSVYAVVRFRGTRPPVHTAVLCLRRLLASGHTHTSPDHSLVSNTPGLTHHAVISSDVSARNTCSGSTSISTRAGSSPSAGSATARAAVMLMVMFYPPDVRRPVRDAAPTGKVALMEKIIGGLCQPREPVARLSVGECVKISHCVGFSDCYPPCCTKAGTSRSPTASNKA